jgi:hypothetical protein
MKTGYSLSKILETLEIDIVKIVTDDKVIGIQRAEVKLQYGNAWVSLLQYGSAWPDLLFYTTCSNKEDILGLNHRFYTFPDFTSLADLRSKYRQQEPYMARAFLGAVFS